jgi:hypothetical protein
MTNIAAIKAFFEADGGRKIEMNEMRALTVEERAELAQMCAKALGVELDSK